MGRTGLGRSSLGRDRLHQRAEHQGVGRIGRTIECGGQRLVVGAGGDHARRRHPAHPVGRIDHQRTRTRRSGAGTRTDTPGTAQLTVGPAVVHGTVLAGVALEGTETHADVELRVPVDTGEHREDLGREIVQCTQRLRQRIRLVDRRAEQGVGVGDDALAAVTVGREQCLHLVGQALRRREQRSQVVPRLRDGHRRDHAAAQRIQQLRRGSRQALYGLVEVVESGRRTRGNCALMVSK